MFKILKFINVFTLAKKVAKYGSWANLIGDTANYFINEGKNRGLIAEDKLPEVTA